MMTSLLMQYHKVEAVTLNILATYYWWQILFKYEDFHIFRCSPSEVFLGKGELKICSKFTEELPYRSATSMKLLCNFTEVALRYGCSPVNLLHIFRTPFLKNTSEGLLLYFFKITCSHNNCGIAIFQIVLYWIDIYYYLCCLNLNTMISINMKKHYFLGSRNHKLQISSL